jgi:hypothetical protein
VWRENSPEEETVVSERRSPSVDVAPTVRDTRPNVVAVPQRKSKTGLLIFASALGTILLLGILGAAYLIFSRANRQENARSNVNVNVATARTPEPSPSLTPTATATPVPANANANANATPDTAEIGREVTKAVAGWQDDTESLDIDALIGRYADNVDYYRNSGVSRDFVRRDKERAFSLYDSVRFEITDMDIKPGPKPDTATAEFDKAWQFDGENHSEGKVRSRLALKKVDGRWLITGERDLKVY